MTTTEHQIDRGIDAEKQPIMLLKNGSFGCGVFAILSVLAIAANELVWELSAERASGHVVAFERRDERSENALYEFVVEGQTYRGKIGPQKGDWRPRVQIGDPVAVLYQSAMPSSFVRDTIEARFWLPMILCLAVIPCWIANRVAAVEIQRLEALRANRKSSLKNGPQ